MDVHSEVLVIKRIYDTIDYIVTTFETLVRFRYHETGVCILYHDSSIKRPIY
jgi:hypothetical protein